MRSTLIGFLLLGTAACASPTATTRESSSSDCRGDCARQSGACLAKVDTSSSAPTASSDAAPAPDQQFAAVHTDGTCASELQACLGSCAPR